MDIQFNCYECIHKQTLTLANKIGQDANSKATAYVDLSNIVNLCISNKVTPPEVAALCYDYFESKTKIKKCKRCGNLSEEDECLICQDQSRDMSTICIVEESKNIILFEKIGSFNGLYHVLGGLISPLEGINPENINIASLLQRIKNENIKEIILAVKPTVEGETTALYIQKLLAKTNVRISKIAHGVPMGADIDYIDPLTLEIALSDRQTIS